MNVQEQIRNYIASQPEPELSDMQALHLRILQVLPACTLWFDDGKNSKNKTLKDISMDTLESAIRYGVEARS